MNSERIQKQEKQERRKYGKNSGRHNKEKGETRVEKSKGNKRERQR